MSKHGCFSINKRKSQYCGDFQVQLKAIESERKRKFCSAQKQNKRIKEEEEQKDKTHKEENSPKILELIKREKLADLMHGNYRVKVVLPSLTVLSQLVGLRFVLHQDMDLICRDSSWLEVTNLLATRNQKPKYLARYLPFRWKAQNWKQDMG